MSPSSDSARSVAARTPARLVGSFAALSRFGCTTSAPRSQGSASFADALTSADSLAWSYRARRDHPLPGCTHKSCANCVHHALRWRAQLLRRLDQQRLEIAA
jgi:hypothetical protein